MTKAILTDVTRCIGCESCVKACVEEYHLGEYEKFRWVRGDGLSASRFCSVLRRPGRLYVRKQCRHCIEPACASACPVGALHRLPNGPVVYDKEKCLGCRYCMMACPYGIPRYEWESPVPGIRKCIMCYKRLEQGRQPACTEACPVKATIFGDRNDLLNEAKARIKANPGKYKHKVFGEKEVGGTSVLYISPVDLNFLFLGGESRTEVFPKLTEAAMHAVPPVFLAMGALMGGLWWVCERREKNMAKKRGPDDHRPPGNGQGGGAVDTEGDQAQPGGTANQETPGEEGPGK
ncbi:MAG: 4Fe-4S dicluster domain-containing protein [Deltaproteobacteria bacterium]|nr:4Fe-4S dicluster domain-containing protein [Deltaproteobacteria bacterium]